MSDLGGLHGQDAQGLSRSFGKAERTSAKNGTAKKHCARRGVQASNRRKAARRLVAGAAAGGAAFFATATRRERASEQPAGGGLLASRSKDLFPVAEVAERD